MCEKRFKYFTKSTGWRPFLQDSNGRMKQLFMLTHYKGVTATAATTAAAARRGRVRIAHAL
jgi:hypothetical protein